MLLKYEVIEIGNAVIWVLTGIFQEKKKCVIVPWKVKEIYLLKISL